LNPFEFDELVKIAQTRVRELVSPLDPQSNLPALVKLAAKIRKLQGKSSFMAFEGLSKKEDGNYLEIFQPIGGRASVKMSRPSEEFLADLLSFD